MMLKIMPSMKRRNFNMKKKVLSILIFLSMAVSMPACGIKAPSAPADNAAPEAPADNTAPADTGSAAPEVTLVYAEVNPLDTIVGRTATAFADKVAELSGGKIKIDVQASGVLGSENDVLDTMLGGGGTIQMSRISAFVLTSYGGEKSKLLSLPYTFVSREHFWAFARSDLAKEFLIEPHDNGSGVRGLFYGEEGFRHFFTTKEISGMSDLSGMKLRVSNDPVMNGLVESLGANPTVVPFNELYAALQTGMVDGAEQPIANYKSNAFPEVAPNLILDAHTLGAIQVIITDEAWDSLTQEQQDILVKAGEYASDFNKKISQDAENKVLEQLKADGVNVIEVDDVTPWQEAVKDVIADNTKGQEALYQQLLDFAK